MIGQIVIFLQVLKQKCNHLQPPETADFQYGGLYS